MSGSPKVRTCLWFDGTGEEAAEFVFGVAIVDGEKLLMPVLRGPTGTRMHCRSPSSRTPKCTPSAQG